MRNLSIAELLKQEKVDIMDLWYDWFCKDTSLQKKGEALFKKLKAISNSTKFDNSKSYVFFKNNCPVFGRLYDDFRICDIETGDVIFTVVPKSGYYADNGLGKVWGYDENGKFKELFKGSWKEIKQWFLGGYEHEQQP